MKKFSTWLELKESTLQPDINNLLKDFEDTSAVFADALEENDPAWKTIFPNWVKIHSRIHSYYFYLAVNSGDPQADRNLDLKQTKPIMLNLLRIINNNKQFYHNGALDVRRSPGTVSNTIGDVISYIKVHGLHYTKA